MTRHYFLPLSKTESLSGLEYVFSRAPPLLLAAVATSGFILKWCQSLPSLHVQLASKQAVSCQALSHKALRWMQKLPNLCHLPTLDPTTCQSTRSFRLDSDIGAVSFGGRKTICIFNFEVTFTA